jgi:hypothetical protein
MKIKTMAALLGGCLLIGAGGCADYYNHGYGDRDCRDHDRPDCHRDNDHRDRGPDEPHFSGDARQ